MITINGYFRANSWNKDKRVFEVRTLGTPDNGAILCGLNVSGKDKDGNREYGKPVDVKINVKSKDEAIRVKSAILAGDSMYSCDGFFVPNNWTKDGKVIQGNQFLVTDSTTFVKHENDSTPKPKVTESIDIDDMPF